MSVDDELRRRLQAAADQAGNGANAGAMTQAVATKAAAGPRPSLRLLGGLGVAGVIVGGVIGFTALKPAESAGAAAVIVDTQRYSLFDCPDGALRGSALPGDRVYVTGRNQAGDWLELRDPRNSSNRAWVPATAVDPDAVADVPVVPCKESVELIADTATSTSTTTSTTIPETTTTTTVPETTTTLAPTTVPVTTPITTKPTVPVTAPPTVPPTVPPTLPPDTQKPVLGQATTSKSEIWDVSGAPYCDTTSIITINATDNVAVTSVQATWTGLPGSPKQFTKGAGNTWTMTFGPFSGLNYTFNQPIQISIVARDAAGNQSTPATVSVTVHGECLI
ncbi:MAG TPA: hypothetical protein PK020_16980 [Ilumatobacteraceae bacterium]|nr:hypothetical protein [Ilumatobacteraceae bacterium]HRB02338.1 hypothetical protein [Ilumatobacteraceae bacterium]